VQWENPAVIYTIIEFRKPAPKKMWGKSKKSETGWISLSLSLSLSYRVIKGMITSTIKN